MKTKGFTLIELMILVAIVSVLAAIFIPAYNDYVEEMRARSQGSTVTVTREVITDRNIPDIEVVNLALHRRNDIYPVRITIKPDSTIQACEVYNTERCYIAKLQRHVDGILYACQERGYCNKVQE